MRGLRDALERKAWVNDMGRELDIRLELWWHLNHPDREPTGTETSSSSELVELKQENLRWLEHRLVQEDPLPQMIVAVLMEQGRIADARHMQRVVKEDVPEIVREQFRLALEKGTQRVFRIF